jgi:hypothetical protein
MLLQFKDTLHPCRQKKAHSNEWAEIQVEGGIKSREETKMEI